jgi:GAF domain-containing protein
MLAQMTARLGRATTFEAAVDTVLDDVIALHGAEYGDLQLSRGPDLVIVAQRMLPMAFVKKYGRIRPGDASASGRALQSRRSIVIRDVEDDPDYQPRLDAARLAGYRSIQSTPLITSGGGMIGVSTLFANPHEPTQIEMSTLNEYSSLASDRLADLLDHQDIGEKALEMSARLFEST